MVYPLVLTVALRCHVKVSQRRQRQISRVILGQRVHILGRSLLADDAGDNRSSNVSRDLPGVFHGRHSLFFDVELARHRSDFTTH